MAAQKSALILLPPEDAEEIEVIVTGDVLVRGGLQVVYAGSSTEPVKCAKGALLVPDVALKDVKNKAFDIIIIPGGPGCSKLAECPVIGELLKTQVKSGGLIGAICAGPTVLLAHGIVAERVTCHYTVKDKMTEGGYKYLDDNVVISDRVITSKGPGTAFEFALKIVETLEGPEKTNSLLKPLCLAK